MLRRRVPIHFGGMSDPFQPAERKWGITKSFLTTLADRRYPVVLSTKGSMVSAAPYLDLLGRIGNVVVQFSFSTLMDSVARTVEPNTAPPSTLLRIMETLARRGLVVTCRWQPYIPGSSEKATEFVSRVASSGARHLALEYLKVPVERTIPRLGRVEASFIEQAKRQYLIAGANRDGREFVYPPALKITTCLDVRAETHKARMSFGAADNELQYLSDGEACCSGVDQFPGFQNVFRYNIGCAVRRGRYATIEYDAIAEEWRPNGSIDRFLNSRSRLGRRLGVEGSVEDHIRYRWSNASASGHPTSFYGVEPTNQLSSTGLTVFRFRKELVNSLRQKTP
jgi:DNA repair photolyase